jgi:hypothetical protein
MLVDAVECNTAPPSSPVGERSREDVRELNFDVFVRVGAVEQLYGATLRRGIDGVHTGKAAVQMRLCLKSDDDYSRVFTQRNVGAANTERLATAVTAAGV